MTYFYDKEVKLVTVTQVVDSDGWARRSEPQEIGSFLGNVQYANLEELRVEHGIEEVVDVSITTKTEVSATHLSYGGRLYEVVKNVPFDSHYLILAKLWTSESLDYVSA